MTERLTIERIRAAVEKPKRGDGSSVERIGNVITIIVDHPPMGAPRMTRCDKWKQRPAVMRYRAFKDAIREAISESRVNIPLAEEVKSLSWVAYFETPKSWAKSKRAAAINTLHRSKPDRDNVDKAVLDAIYTEDAAIAKGTIEKRWGYSGCVIIKIEGERRIVKCRQ